MFSSKTPRDLNHDPYPNVWDGHTPFNQMRADHDKFRKGAPVGVIGSMTYLHRPRPEFDHVQHNPPNPILVAFRTEVRLQREADWLPMHAVAETTLERQDGFEDATGAQCAHARRVLTRLARLSEWAELEAAEAADDYRYLPIHRTEAGYPNCSTCDGGGCLDCTDPAN
ncbi:MAG: hypothetical protein RL430_2110 [Actinomycetota bacterium]|jgi:hypothetical protein